ncbi:hypothetical protein, partial [Klebsiella pneumoniae]|uniref:hypothetical protein n=1 Tax=Klebsiella pneumoniae TaxID=573 RepID=UPI0022387334
MLWVLGARAESGGNLRREAVARGIAAERGVFAQRASLPDHLARHRLLAQICASLGVGFEQPQHAALDAAEDPHPPVEHAGRDLV